MHISILKVSTAVMLTAWPVAVGFAQSNVPQSISAADKATGAKAHPELLSEFGGLYAGPQADYVRRVGQKAFLVNDGIFQAQQQVVDRGHQRCNLLGDRVVVQRAQVVGRTGARRQTGFSGSGERVERHRFS